MASMNDFGIHEVDLLRLRTGIEQELEWIEGVLRMVDAVCIETDADLRSTKGHQVLAYQNRINELLEHHGVLNHCLLDCWKYQSQIRRYWDDEYGQNYYELLEEQIQAVQQAKNRIESLVQACELLVERMVESIPSPKPPSMV